MAVGFSLEHAQVAPVGASPVHKDIPAVVSWAPSITASRTPLRADASIYANAYGAREGSGDIVFAFLSFDVLVIINGGTKSTSGTGAGAIDRYEQPGASVQPAFIVSGFYRNVATDKNPHQAVRVTTPVNTAAPASASFAQETFFNWTANTSFTQNDAGTMIIYETMASLPVLTAGVMPVNLAAPGA